MLETMKTFLLKLWSDLDIQVLVLISLMMQLFLLFTGKLRRRRISGFFRFLIWLAYVGADAVAIYAVGLLTQYEEKFKLRGRQLPEDHTLPFLWAPFLLLHLGGQDTITAFSMEDNNLWSRYLLKFGVQLTLTFIAFWQAYEILGFELLAVAGPLFVAGIIKYGERVWALYSGSREYLSTCLEGVLKPVRDYNSTSCGDVMASYALNMVLRVRELLVGRTLFQLGEEVQKELVDDFQEREGMLKIVMAELGMIYDLLYTKAMVLQSRNGFIFRWIADTSMVVAFVLFLVNDQFHAYKRADYIITCILFAGALFMEVCSVSMVIVSPWTRAVLKKGTILLWLSRSACSVFNAIVHSKTQQQQMPSFSMGQFNVTDYSMSLERRPKLISKVISALGLQKQERSIWYTDHVKDKGIISYIGSLYSTGEGSQWLELGRTFIDQLERPFEHTLFNLHLYTDLYLNNIELKGDEMVLLATECMTLSNYLMYLMLNCPSMLPVSSAAQDLLPRFTNWVRLNRFLCGVGFDTVRARHRILKNCMQTIFSESSEDTGLVSTPLELLAPSVASLMMIKEMWARLLIYAAGKCPMELHARQLSNGVEPITFLSFLMLQHAEGDAGKREVSLFTPSDDDSRVYPRSRVSVGNASLSRLPHRPHYAFRFRQHDQKLSVAPWAPPLSSRRAEPDDGATSTPRRTGGYLARN